MGVTENNTNNDQNSNLGVKKNDMDNMEVSFSSFGNWKKQDVSNNMGKNLENKTINNNNSGNPNNNSSGINNLANDLNSGQNRANSSSNNNLNNSENINNKNKISNDDSNLELVNSNRQITDEEIQNAPIILIEELNGDILKNNKLKINAGGLTTGLRKSKDGVVFFGKVK
jgi:hypothetical protein